MSSTPYRRRLFAAVVLVALANAASADDPEGGTLQFSKRCLVVQNHEGCAIADLNRDGKPDILAGPWWFAGPDFDRRPLRPAQESADYLSSNGDHVYDVDGDRWPDVVIGGWMDPGIYWFRNPGADDLERGVLWERHLLKETRDKNEAYCLHDFDGDGTPEILVSCWVPKDPLVVWRLASGTDAARTLERFVLGTQGGGHGYAFGDVNGDGREDVLCEVGWYERPPGNPFAGPWAFHAEAALPHPSCPFVTVDLNKDGRLDIIWGKAHDYGLYWWEQGEPKADGTTTWTEHLIDKSWSQAHCLAWADLDGDGRGELITGKRVLAHGGRDPGGKDPAVCFYYAWDTSESVFKRHVIGTPGEDIGIGMQIGIADLNSDRRTDLVAPGKTGTWLLLNRGPASKPAGQ
jgi:hypothetical protein